MTHEVEWKEKRYPAFTGWFRIGRSNLDGKHHWFYVDRVSGDYELVPLKQMLKLFAGIVYVSAKPTEFYKSTDFKADAKEYVARLSKRSGVTY